jgi:GNAT superfamily N-acetyltransferase
METAPDRPRPDGSDIRKARPADTDALAAILAEAFHDDPHFIWITPDESNRRERLLPGFKLFVERLWMPVDEGFIHEDGFGCALWMPPGTAHVSILTQLAMLPRVLSIMRGDVPRFMKINNMMEKKHPKAGHYYLPVIGVRRANQGKGFGAQLLRPMLERCDAERVPAYLEASTPRNRALYERHGFELVEECRCADDAPPLFRMWREPAAG